MRYSIRTSFALLMYFLHLSQIFAQQINLPTGTESLTEKELKTRNKLVRNGVDYLKRMQTQAGTWYDAPVVVKYADGFGSHPRVYPIGYACLPAIALLECGVSNDDPSIEKAAKYVRDNMASIMKTYEVSLSILLFDRIGDPKDVGRIKELSLRLIAAQTPLGGWGYTCPLLTEAQLNKVRDGAAAMNDRNPDTKLIDLALQTDSPKNLEKADHSNTQFAILGLWVGRRHGAPASYSLRLTGARFRASQRQSGWSYNLFLRSRDWGAMTCVGLLALAADQSLSGIKAEELIGSRVIETGIASLSQYMGTTSDTNAPKLHVNEVKDSVNYYFLWSIERVGTFCQLRTIGATDWYKWGFDSIAKNQRPDGSWLGRGSGASPVADTSFALLFLRKSDLLPDLRKELAKRVKIVDPGPPELKAGIAKEGKVDPKKAVPKPKDEKPPSSAQEGPPSASLGKVQIGQATELPLKVRGPEAFRILKVEGTDGAVKVDFDKKSREVHELAVTVKGAEPGEIRRTLTLVTDLPDLREVEIRVIVRVEGAKSP